METPQPARLIVPAARRHPPAGLAGGDKVVRPAAATVAACYVKRQRARRAAGPIDAAAISGLVRTALEAGISSRDVATGMMLGALRTSAPGEVWLARARGAAAAVFRAALRQGGLIQPTIEGIMAGTISGAGEAGRDGDEAMAAVVAGVTAALDDPELLRVDSPPSG